MDIVYRCARKEESQKLVEYVFQASDGILEFSLHDLIPNTTPKQIFAYVLSEDTSPTSYKDITVAEVNGDIVGMILSFPSENHKLDERMKRVIPQDRIKFLDEMYNSNVESSLYVQSLCVKEEYRGQGIGTKLIELTKQNAKRQGYKYVSLIVFDENKNALQLYKQNNFSIAKHIELYENQYFPYKGGAYLMASLVD